MREMKLNAIQIGILKDVAANKVDLDEIDDWMRDQLCELILYDPMLIDTQGPSVFLTDAGRGFLAALSSAEETKS